MFSGGVNLAFLQGPAVDLNSVFDACNGLGSSLENNVSITVVPLPGAAWLFLSALVALTSLKKRSALRQASGK